MSYVVLARKWRPMSFEDLIGQSHVSRTLANAIQSGRVAHAFLFTGVRGVGKTTSARILAKALNCMGTAAEPHTGPTVTPCLECAACKEITAGTDVDVREIDGASYNGVDEVRKLQDSLPYRPARDRFKIFIVDEVHMLSQSAWNAFLKTLEEPPPHVKFIFATTEVHKVPVTILSRVQRFDFKLIPTQLIAKRLKHVLTSEGISSDDRALSIIAREAAGSMRDAMSLLDQVIAWNDQALDGDSVARVLGVASRQILHDLAAGLVAGDAAKCLRITSELANQGYDVASVTKDVLAVLRDLVVAKMCEDPSDLLDLADEEQRDVKELASRTSADDLVRLHQGFSAGFDDVVRSGQARAALEMLLVRLARRPALIPIDDLLTRLSALEKRLGGAPRGGAAAASSGPGPAPRGGPPAAPGGRGGGFSPGEARPAPPPADRHQGREARPASPEPRSAALADPADEPPRADAAPATAGSTAARAAPAPPGHLAPPPAPPPPPASGSKADAAPPAAAGPAPGTASGPAVPDSPLLVEWRAIVERVRVDAPQLAAFLHHASIVELGRERVVIAFEAGSVFEKSAKAADSVELIRRAAQAHLGGEPALVFETTTTGTSGTTVAAAESRERSERQREALARAKQHPKLAEVAQILGARLKEIRLPDE